MSRMGKYSFRGKMLKSLTKFKDAYKKKGNSGLKQLHKKRNQLKRREKQ